MHVQAHAQGWRRAAEAGGFMAPRKIDQQARAGQDAPLVGFQDAAVDAVAGAKIVSVDDEIFHSATGLAARASVSTASTGSRFSNHRSISANSSNPQAAGSFSSA